MLQNPSFSKFFSKEHFPQPPQNRVRNEVFTIKETCPPILYIVLQDS